MHINVGGIDRVVRLLVGIVLAGIAVYFVPNETTKSTLLAIATLSQASAWFGFSFLNKIFGISTVRRTPIQR